MEERTRARMGIRLKDAWLEGRGVDSGSRRRNLRGEMVGFTLKSKISVFSIRRSEVDVKVGGEADSSVTD
jgi:hypothetical protein